MRSLAFSVAALIHILAISVVPKERKSYEKAVRKASSTGAAKFFVWLYIWWTLSDLLSHYSALIISRLPETLLKQSASDYVLYSVP